MPDPALEPLERPPIFEVACGIEFAPIDAIDPVLVGGFWLRKRERFPHHETHPEIPRRAELSITRGLGPVRTWLVSERGEFVVQIQRDRLVLNWRFVGEGGAYPRFSSTPDGVLARALAEFDAFGAYLEETVGLRPSAQRVEALKVDLFVEGRDWIGHDDLGRLMPTLGPMLSLGPLQQALPALRLFEEQGDTTIDVRIETLPITPTSRHLRLTTTVNRAIDASLGLEGSARAAGATANEVFASLIPRDERVRRFGNLKEDAP